MPSYSKAKGASFATGPGKTTAVGSRAVFRGPGKTAMRGPNPSRAVRITRRGAVGAGPRRTVAIESILLSSARGNAADGS